MNKERQVITTIIRSNVDDPKGPGTEEVTKEYVVYPDGTPLAKYSASADYPLQIYTYGNAKVSAHISMPFMADPLDAEKTAENLEETIKSVHSSLDKIIGERITEYTDMLEKRNISWQKIESEMKKGK